MTTTPAPSRVSDIQARPPRCGRRRLAQLLVLVSISAVALVGPGIDLGGVELGTSCATAQEGARAGLVVDFGGVGGGPDVVSIRCLPIAPGATGADLLVAAGHELRFNRAGLLCAIDRYPESGCGDNSGGGYRFWSYWRASPGSEAWTYASIGPATGRLSDGSIEGWRFVEAPANPNAPKPRFAPSIDQVCARPEPPAPAPPPTTAPATSAPAPPLAPGATPPPGGAPGPAPAPPSGAGPVGAPGAPAPDGGPSATTPGLDAPVDPDGPAGSDPAPGVAPSDEPAPGTEAAPGGEGDPLEVRAEDGIDLVELVARGSDDAAGDATELAVAGDAEDGRGVGGAVAGVALVVAIGAAAAVGLRRRSNRSP